MPWTQRTARPAATDPSGWQLRLVLFFVTAFVESMSMSHVFAFLPVYLQSMSVSHVQTWVGILSAITFVAGLPLVPLWGIWAQRYGGKAVIIRSAYVETVVFLLLGISHSLAGVFVAMLLVGFQLGNTGVMLSAIRQAAPESRIGYAVSVFSSASTVAMAGGPLIGGLLTGTNLVNLHGLFLIDGALSLGTGTMLLLFYREQRPARAASASATGSTAASGFAATARAAEPSAWSAAWQSVRFTFSLPISWALFGIYTVFMMGQQMVRPYVPIAIEHLPIHGISITLAIGLLMGFSAIVGSVIAIFAGRLGDRLGFTRILSLGLILAAPGAVLLGLTHLLSWFVVVQTVFTAGTGMGGAMIFALFSVRIPESHRSTALNLVYLPLYIGGIIGPAVSSGLTHIAFAGPFVGSGCMFLAGIVIMLLTVVRWSRRTVDSPSLEQGVL